MNTVIPLISTIVALVFAITVLSQFFTREKPYQLAWAVGLFMYFISTGTEFWTGWQGLDETVYRLWYLFGAILVVAYLGLGTVYLLLRRRIAHIVLAVIAVASIYAAFRVFTADIDLSVITQLSGTAMPDSIRRMTPFFNVFGTVALVGGAIYSAIVFRRSRNMGYRVLSNVLIAGGAILPALGGSLLRLGWSVQTFYLLELAGIVVIFIGFLRSREVFGFRQPSIADEKAKVSVDGGKTK